MPSGLAGNTSVAAAERSDTLALLFQGIFTGVVRIQSGKQSLSDLETFRRRMKAALQEVERDAITAGYSTEDIRDAQFAVVALLDEAILSSREPSREQWRTKPLNTELFGEAIAGEVFFDRLQILSRRQDSTGLADVLEVYLLCILLGFEGRLSGPMRGEAMVMADRLRRRIETIRGADYKLSPPMEFSPANAPPASVPKTKKSNWPKIVLGVAAGLVALFLIYKITLGWGIERVEQLGLLR
jgi:type VI secretion system protein ImpK